MATVFWVGNAQNTQMVVTVQVTAVANGAVLTATLNGGTISYTCTASDTTTTAAAAWLALLAASTTPPEYQEITFAAGSAGSFTATAKAAGTPFAGLTNGFTVSATGGATVTQITTTPNSSESDAANAQNWRRNNVAALPQDNDDLIVSGSAPAILWNLDTAIANVRLASYTRWQSFTQTIGLPEFNPNGYFEWRATYLKLKGGGISGVSSSSSSGGGASPVLNVLLGYGQGTGPTRERYDFQGSQFNAICQASGTPADAYAIRLLGTNGGNVVTVYGTSVAVAMLAGESANLASATVGAAGLIGLGPNAVLSAPGSLTVTSGQAIVNCPATTILVQDQGAMLQGTVASALKLSYPSITLKNQSSLQWQSGSDITNLTLQTSSSFAKATPQAMTLGTLTIDVDTCTFVDPYNCVSFSNACVLNNALRSGPFRFPAGRTFRIT